jgi:radical SAM protein with 4Fe4S-binding SPASM domain
MKRVIDDLAALGTELIQLTGGEPLTRPDLFEILRHAADRGIDYGLVTNATLVDRYREELRALPPAAVKVSVDGPPALHDRIRGARNFEQCLAALDLFRELGVGTRVLCTTVNRWNLPELPVLYGHVATSAATRWEFHLCVREGRAKTHAPLMFLERSQLATLFRFVLDYGRYFPIGFAEEYFGPYTRALCGQRFFCGSGWNTFTIMPNGDVAGCPAFESRWTEGNLREKPVGWIWHNRFERFRKAADLPEDCRRCPHLPACGGGCWMMRRTGDHCTRDIWEAGLSAARLS